MEKTKFIVTIEATYKSEGEGDPDPSALLDSVQDNIKELLEPYGEEVDEFEVSVEDKLVEE